MDEKLITLTDGTKLEVKVNFLTLYMIQKNGLAKILTGKKENELSEDENMEAAAKLIHVILRSNKEIYPYNSGADKRFFKFRLEASENKTTAFQDKWRI